MAKSLSSGESKGGDINPGDTTMGAVPVNSPLSLITTAVVDLIRSLSSGRKVLSAELMATHMQIRTYAPALSIEERASLRALLLQMFLDDLGADECWDDILSPLVDHSKSLTLIRRPAISVLPAPTVATVAPARASTYGEQRALDELIQKEHQRLCAEYNVPVLEDTAELYDWIKQIDAFMRTVAYARHSPAVWRAIIAKVIVNRIRPKNLGHDEVDRIANGVKQRCEECDDTNCETLALTLWSKHITPFLVARLDNHVAQAQAHQHLELIQGENESAVHFINRALCRVESIKFVNQLVAPGKSWLSQLVNALRDDVRGLFENLLSLNKINDIETLKEKLGELDLPRITMMNKGTCQAGPASVEEIEVFAVLKRGRERSPNPIICFRCRGIGHWSIWCLSVLTVSPGDCSRCGGTHQLSSCPTAGPVQCGRFDCQADHLPQRCPVIIHAVNSHNKRVALPNTNVSGRSGKRPRVDFNAVTMLDNVECNALETELSVNAVSDIPANLVVSPLDISRLAKGAIQAKCEYSSVGFISFLTSRVLHELKCLLDAGANINVLPLDFVQRLLDDPRMAIPKDQVQRLLHRPQASLANGELTDILEYVYLPVLVERQSYNIPFLIFPPGSKAILGTPALQLIFGHTSFDRTRRLVAAANRLQAAAMEVASPPLPDEACSPPPPPTSLMKTEPYIKIAHVNNQKRLICHVPLLENAHVLPARERPRDHNPTVQKIIYEKIKQMEAENKVSRASPSEVSYTSPLVLVDKHAAQKKPKRYPLPPEDQGRWRLTLDNRGLNDMRILASPDRIVFVPSKITHAKSSTGAVSYAPTGRHLLREFKVENCEAWAKTDLTNAFDQVLLADGLRHLFGADVFNPETCEWELYVWNVLPQGWTFSPLLFRLAVEELKAMALSRLATKTSAPIPPQVKNLADDLLTGGSSKELVSLAQSTLHEVLEEHGFPVNLAKCISASRDSTFCGSLLDGCLVQPTATRKPILNSFAESAWLDLTSGKMDPLHWLRSIAGHFQFLKGHLNREMEEHLKVFYEAISLVQRDPKANIDNATTREALEALVNYACNGLPQLVLARFPAVHATLIVVDASPTSWAATLFLLATVPDSTATQLPDTTAIVEQLRCTEQFRHRALPRNVGLIPTYIIGDTFHERGASSTWYERRAQLEAVHALYHLCEGPIYVVSDNANSGKKWHDVDAAFSGTAYAKLQHFQANVAGILWQRRDNLPAISDALARIVDAYSRARPPSSPAQANATEPPQMRTAANAAPPNPSKAKTAKGKKVKTSATHVNAAAVAVPSSTPTQSPIQIPSPVTKLPESLRLFLQEVKHRYSQDTTQFVPSVPMSLVYSILSSTAPPTTRLGRLAHKRFRLSTDGFLFLKSPSVDDRLYVPNFVFFENDGGRHSRGYLINHFHCTTGPHLGISRTEADLCRSFFWPRMRNDVARFIGACMTCHTRKATHVPATGSLSSVVAQANHPFDILLMDFAAIPKTNDSFLLIMDAFSHYTFAFRTKDQTAETVKAVLTNLFTQLSAPNRIHCDRGRRFNADVIHELSRSLGFALTFSPAGNPRSQGAAESAVKSVKTMLSTTLSRRRPGDSLDLCLRTAVQVHNSTAIVRLGLCPAEILLGFRPRLPGLWPPDSPAQDGPLSIPELDTIRHALRTVWRIRRDEYIARYQDRYFLEARESKIRPGDYVQYQPPLTAPGKTFPNPRGFFRVLKAAGSNTWYLSRDQWLPNKPLEPLGDLAVGDIAPENHLVRFEPAPDLRLGLDPPTPPPPPPHRPATRATGLSSRRY